MALRSEKTRSEAADVGGIASTIFAALLAPCGHLGAVITPEGKDRCREGLDVAMVHRRGGARRRTVRELTHSQTEVGVSHLPYVPNERYSVSMYDDIACAR